MATKVHHLQIPALPGVRDLYTLLDVLKNQKQYTALLEELEGKRKAVNDLVEVAGDAEEIKEMHAQLTNKLAHAETQANKILQDARNDATATNERAEAVLKDAMERSDTMMSEAQTRRDNAAREIDEQRAVQARRTAELNELADKLAAQEKDLRQREAKAKADLEEGQKLQTIYNEKLAKIKALQGEL